MISRRSVLAAAPALLLSRAAAAQTPLTVYAAASLVDAVPLIGAALGAPIRSSLASSAVLARQIEAGAPADVFLSADEAWMDYLAERRLIRSGSRTVIAGNRLVLVAPRASRVALTMAPNMPLLAALGRDGRLALADPASVPAGRYAQAALEHLGVWSAVERRVVRAENVRAALTFVARGEAPLGIVYATDAQATPAVRVVGRFPAGSHPPIRYPGAVLAATTHPLAARFLQAGVQPAVQRQLGKLGFLPVQP
jgi:molybdate transport system substrate-binding protein